MEETEDKLEEKDSIEYNKIKLEREWTFWENYEMKDKNKKVDYSELIQPIFNFNTIIDFWQFWNIYPGNNPSKLFFDGEKIKYFFEDKKRIIAINLFENGIKPEWEDKKNEDGHVFTMDYIIDNKLDQFYLIVPQNWNKLMMGLIGETLMNSEYINGIRFVDKTTYGKKTMFRFEIWANKNMPQDEIMKSKVFYGKEFGCPGIFVKDIESKK